MKLDIFCENDGKTYTIEEGTRISELLAISGCKCRFPVIAALENNLLKEDCLFVLEHGKKNNFETHPHFVERRVYGSVNFSFFR